jgi:hypothetical protein
MVWGQLFFPEALAGAVYRPRALTTGAHGRDTRHATDSIFRNRGPRSNALSKDGMGDVAPIAMGVSRS